MRSKKTRERNNIIDIETRRNSLIEELVRKIYKGYTIIKTEPKKIISIINKNITRFYQKILLHIIPNKIVFSKKKPLVSVIMTAFNSQSDIKKAIYSILEQSYKNIELIIVDDESLDDTINIVRKIAEKDSRVKILQNNFNKGTYWCRNYAIMFAKGDFITFQDSDDISDLARIKWQLKALILFKNSVGSVVNYIRVRTDGSTVISSNGTKKRLLVTGTMFRRSVFEKVGYFDSVRFGADSEFFHRVETYFNKCTCPVVYINKILYTALTREGSITSTESKIDFEKDVISNERLSHMRTFREYHNKYAFNKERLYFSFPLRIRPFDLPQKMIRGINNNFDIIAYLDCNNNKNTLQRSIENILSQIDRVYINCPRKYKELSFLQNNNITIVESDISQNKQMECLKNILNKYEKENDDFYCLLLNSDMRYPKDYVSKMIIKDQVHGNSVVFGLAKDVNQIIIEDKITQGMVNSLSNSNSIIFHSSIQDKFLNNDKTLKFYLIEQTAE